jgi:signal peptidase II
MAEGRPRTYGPLSALGLGVIIATLVIDQVTKLLAERTLNYGQSIDLLPVLSLYRVHNTGIAFSLFSGFGSAGLLVVMLVVTAIVLAIWQMTTDGGRLIATGYALIVGGALGNIIDRLAYGHVIDFLYLHLGDWSLFVFNLADAALTVGPALLIIAFLWPRSRAPDGG